MMKQDEVLKDIIRLENENSALRAEIKKIDERELFETVKYYTYHAKYKFYRKLPLDFLSTSFYTNRYDLQKRATGCFINDVLDAAVETSKNRLDKELILHFALACEDIEETQSGLLFTLSDPYQTIKTMPITTMSLEEAMKYRGRILIVKLLIPANYRGVTYFEMKGIKLTSYAKISKNPSPDVKILEKYTTIKDERNGIRAIDEIEHYFRLGGSRVHRFSPTLLRVIKKDKKIVIVFENDKLWYADEPYIDSELGGMFFDMLGEEEKLKEFYLEGELECNINF